MSIDPERLERQRSHRIDDPGERSRKGYLLGVYRRRRFEAWIESERAKGKEPSIDERIEERERIKRETEGA